MLKQKKLSDMKNNFINNMTHELKIPIPTISLAIDSITHPVVINNEAQINHLADIIRIRKFKNGQTNRKCFNDYFR